MSDYLKTLKQVIEWDGELTPCVDCGEELATRSVGGTPVCRTCHAAAYERVLEDRIRELEAENAAMRGALDGIYIYANDTLSGRTDGGADDRDWQRAAVVEIRDRALAYKGEVKQPIETAPKDGTWVLLFGGKTDEDDYCNEGVTTNRPVVAFWDESDEAHGWVFCFWDGKWRQCYENPTHWMPVSMSALADKGEG